MRSGSMDIDIPKGEEAAHGRLSNFGVSRNESGSESILRIAIGIDLLSYHVERRLLECSVDKNGQPVAARVRSALWTSSFDATLVLKGINLLAYEKTLFLTVFKSLQYSLLFHVTCIDL